MADLDYLQCKPMFSGYGLYCLKIFFGILHEGRLFFRTNDATRPAYLAAGSEPFRPNDKQTLKHYYEVPADVLENPSKLVDWARNAADWHGRDVLPR